MPHEGIMYSELFFVDLLKIILIKNESFGSCNNVFLSWRYFITLIILLNNIHLCQSYVWPGPFTFLIETIPLNQFLYVLAVRAIVGGQFGLQNLVKKFSGVQSNIKMKVCSLGYNSSSMAETCHVCWCTAANTAAKANVDIFFWHFGWHISLVLMVQGPQKRFFMWILLLDDIFIDVHHSLIS